MFIKNIYQHAGKCDDQQNLRDILDATMVSTKYEVTDDIPNAPMTSTPVKKTSARKELYLFTNILNVKNKTARRRIGSEESKRRAMQGGNSLWTKKTKQKGHSKINEHIKRNIYALFNHQFIMIVSKLYMIIR